MDDIVNVNGKNQYKEIFKNHVKTKIEAVIIYRRFLGNIIEKIITRRKV
jgi:hypothetical protein